MDFRHIFLFDSDVLSILAISKLEHLSILIVPNLVTRWIDQAKPLTIILFILISLIE